MINLLKYNKWRRIIESKINDKLLIKMNYDKNGRLSSKIWRNKKGEIHREDGPAYITYYNSGNIKKEIWHKNGIYYREDKSYTGWDMYQAMTATPSAKSLDPTREVIEIYKMFL